jgi:regulatory protein SWI5
LLNCNTFNDKRQIRTLQAFIMLSNPTKTLHNRQRQHRRQNSTPTAFDPVKTNNLPNTQQKHGAHRRGMSLDQRRRQTPPQDVMVSTTNLGYQTTQQQHILRETQQQRPVRPGQHFNLDNDENYLSSPAITPQRQSFDAGYINYGERAHAQTQYHCSGPINGLAYVDPNNFTGTNDFDLFAPEGQLTPSAYLDFSTSFDNTNALPNGGNGSRRSSGGRRISDGILGRVAQFENMTLQSPQRPITPPNQNVSSKNVTVIMILLAAD